jgi:hypothetical protein
MKEQGPMRMMSPSASGSAPSTQASLTQVPLALPASSMT